MFYMCELSWSSVKYRVMIKKLSKKELNKTIERQEKIIKNYESVSFVYSFFRRLPLFDKFVRFSAGILKNKNVSGTKVIIGIKNKNPDIIAIVSPEFRGVKAATVEMVPDMIEISEIFNRRKATELAKQIIKYSPKKILVSGYAKGHDLLIEELKKANPNLRIFVLIHSAFIWFDVYPAENAIFERFIEMAKEGIIEKIGFCKKDLAEYFGKQRINTFFVMNRFQPEKNTFKTLNKTNINIGVFGKNMWHRNITNQVIGALSVKNTEVHVNEISDHFFIDKTRVTVHGILPRDEFLKLYKKLDVSLYISMTECFPMVAIESMQHGVPCLVSDTSDVYAFNPKLKSWLTVSTIDSPIGISKKINEVIDNYDDIQKEIKSYLPVLKKEVEKSIEEFLK